MATASYLSLYSTNQTIGKQYRFQIYSYDSSYLHKVVLNCGNYTQTWDRVKGGVETNYTVPLEFAKAMPNATNMNGTITLTTYQSNYSTKVGSNEVETIKFTIDNNTMKPNINVTIEEAVDGIAEQFGAYIQGKSKITMNIKGTGIYGSTIKKYNTTINGVSYTSNSFTTGLLKLDADVDYTYMQYSSQITDSRGQTNSLTDGYKILSYHNPKINGFEVYRCDRNGNINDEGTCVKVISNASIKPCNDGTNNKNTKLFKLSYKLTTSEEWNEIELDSSSYNLVDERVIEGFDINSSYNFKIEAIDFFGEDNKASKTIIIGSSDNIMDFHYSGKGMAVGKASELQNVFDVGWATKLTGGLSPVVLEADTDLDDVRTPNFYTGENVTNYNYANCPITRGTFYLEVVSCGEQGQVRQRISSCDKDISVTYERFYYLASWGEWKDLYIGEEVIYNNPDGSNGTIELSRSSSEYKYIEIFYKDNDGTCSSVKVYEPNTNLAELTCVECWGSGVYIKQRIVLISDNTIETTTYSETRLTDTPPVTISSNNYIYITRVVGYR